MSLTKVTYSMIEGTPSGTVGDGVTDDYAALQAWQNEAYTNQTQAFLPAGVYYCSDNLIIKTDTFGAGSSNSQIIFADGKGFRTYTSTTQFYAVNISNIAFISDKSSYWNATAAGDAYDAAVTNPAVKRLYGARVWKGNKTTTPNNICATDPTERLNGTGFWNKDYTQWTQTDGVSANITLAGSTAFNADTCIYYAQGAEKTISGCLFQGFDAVVITGTYMLSLNDNKFSTMKKGILAINATYIGGSSAVRVTTNVLHSNTFEDCWVGFYAQDFLQGVINNENVFQPCIVGVYIGGGGAPECLIEQNYFEICHTAVYHFPNLNNSGRIGPNFTNAAYTYYLAWLNNGQNITISGPVKSTQKIYVGAGVTNSSFPAGCDVVVSQPFFLDNGNAIARGQAKRVIYKITGVSGTSTTIEVENTPGAGDVPISSGAGFLQPAIVRSGQNGLVVPANIVANKLELLNFSGESIETFAADPIYTAQKAYFFSVFDSGTSQFVNHDFRVNGRISYVRLTFSESVVPTPA